MSSTTTEFRAIPAFRPPISLRRDGAHHPNSAAALMDGWNSIPFSRSHLRHRFRNGRPRPAWAITIIRMNEHRSRGKPQQQGTKGDAFLGLLLLPFRRVVSDRMMLTSRAFICPLSPSPLRDGIIRPSSHRHHSQLLLLV
jgi:hypothetical protein